MFQPKSVLVIIKHDAVTCGNIGNIINILEQAGGQVTYMNMRYLTLTEAQELYLEHKDKDFYTDLCKWMCTAPSVIMRVYESCKSLNELKPAIRTLYGTDTRRNAIHISDSPDAAKRELKLFNISEVILVFTTCLWLNGKASDCGSDYQGSIPWRHPRAR